MAFVLAAILVLAPFAVLYIVDNPPTWAHRRPYAPAVTQCDDAPAVALTADEAARCEVEGLLARRLLAGEVDHDAYHSAMAELAVRDAQSRPLRVPGDSTG